jgi:hypothetical protein
MREAIKDKNSKLVGYVKVEGDKTKVYDKNSGLLGEASSKGTFDKNHKLITKSNLPGLFF